MRCGGEWASLSRKGRHRLEPHDHDQARAGQRIEAWLFQKLVAVAVRAPGPHAVNPAPIASSIIATAASATAAAHPNADAAAAAATVTATSTAMAAATVYLARRWRSVAALRGNFK